MRIFLSLLLFSISYSTFAQRIYGTVFTETGDLLPFASVTIKGSTRGASANDKARFSFSLSRGEYTVVCQHIGYATSEKKVIVNGDVEVTFILTEQKLTMTEVVVKSGDEDPAYEIIRQAIRKREFYAKQVDAFKVDLYGKDLIKLRELPNRIFGKKIPKEDKAEMGVDSTGKGIVYLSESLSTVSVARPDKFKLEVNSSRVSGSGGFGFTFPTFISLYSNNVKMFTDKLNPRGFISPIADGAIGFYKFKFLGTFWEDGKAVNSIRVTPRRKYEPLFTGVINIMDDTWRIHSFNLEVTKTAQLEILDTLRISQLYVPVTKEVWQMKNQLLYFNFKQFGIDAIGNFQSVFSNYNLQPGFSKKYFDNVVIKYDTAVNKRSTAFWDSSRPVPLEKEEILDYQVKDSLYTLRKDSAASKQTIDSLNAKQGKLQLQKIVWPGIDRTRYSAHNRLQWGIEPLLLNLEYNTAEGITQNVNGYIETNLRNWRSKISIEPHLRYGFSNGHLNAWTSVRFDNINGIQNGRNNNVSWQFSGGKRVSQFNKNSKLSPLVNSISTLLYGRNYLKTYENYFGNAVYKNRFESGLTLVVQALFEDRIPLNNSTNFTFDRSDSIYITPNYPYEKIPSQFTRHQAAIVEAAVSFTPGQRYIQFPNTKIPIGSKYPTISIAYTKAIQGVFGSDASFDKWKMSIEGQKNMRIAGLLKFHLGQGGFLSRKSVFIQDYHHFNGNRSLAASEYVNSFQLASFYGNSTTASYFLYGQAEHHLNGLLTNKIPLFRRLNWNMVAGSNAFYVNKNNSHLEFFAGLENIFKIFRVDYVVALRNGSNVSSAFRIGTGGVIGGSMRVSGTGRQRTLSF